MLNWEGNIGPGGLAAIGALLFSAANALIGIGLRRRDLELLSKQIDKIESRIDNLEDTYVPGSEIDKRFIRVETQATKLDLGMDAFQVAVNQQTTITREQINEGFRRNSETFATKDDLRGVEQRTTQGMDRIFKSLDRIDAVLGSGLID